MTGRPDLEDLDMLMLVARTGSIGQVAAQLGLSQPSVSRRMAALERALRVPLLQRSRRGSALTPAGRVVVDWAATLLGAADEFTGSVEMLREQREQGVGTVRAAVSMTIAEHYAPAWLARLRVREPETVVSLQVHNSTGVADVVESGGVEVGFVESPTVRKTLRRRRFGWDRLLVAVPPEHAWGRRARLRGGAGSDTSALSPQELAGAPLLVRESGSGTRETLEASLRRQGLDLIPTLALASNAALKSSALAGMGPVVLSELSLAPEIATGALVAVPVELELRRPLSVVWRRDASLSGAAAALVKVAGEPARESAEETAGQAAEESAGQ